MPSKRPLTRSVASSLQVNQPENTEEANKEDSEIQSTSRPCGECGKLISDRGIHCEGTCRWWYHLDCLQLTEEESTALCTPDSIQSWKCDRCLAVSTTIAEILETTRSLSARVHTLETINRELNERLELLESDDQPSAQGYSPDNSSPTEAEMTVLLPPTEINNLENKTEGQQQPKQQQQQKQKQKQKQHQQPKQQQQKQKQEKQQQQQSRYPSPSKRDRRMTMFIRRVPRDTQIGEVIQHLRGRKEINVNDLHITQPVPDSEFKGRWKFLKCEGPGAAMHGLVITCEQGRLPWKVNASPPSRPNPFLDEVPMQGRSERWREHPTPTPPHHFLPPPPLPSIPPLTPIMDPPFPHPHTQFPHPHFVQGPPPPPTSRNLTFQRHPWPQLWQAIRDQGRQISDLRRLLGDRPAHPHPQRVK